MWLHEYKKILPSIFLLLGLQCLAQDHKSTNDRYVIDKKDLHGIETHTEFVKRILEAAKQGPNFAGSYTLIMWSCGFVCVSSAVVDQKTKKVYFVEFTASDCPYASPRKAVLEFSKESDVIKINGVVEWDGGKKVSKCGVHTFQWIGNRMKYLSFADSQP